MSESAETRYDGKVFPAYERFDCRNAEREMRPKITRILLAGLGLIIIAGVASLIAKNVAPFLIMFGMVLIFGICVIGIYVEALVQARDEWLNGATTQEEADRRRREYRTIMNMIIAGTAVAAVAGHEMNVRSREKYAASYQARKDQRARVRQHNHPDRSTWSD